MTKQKDTCDANNRGEHIKPRNSSQSFARGGGVMRHAEQQHRDQTPHDISGGSRQSEKRIQPVTRDPPACRTTWTPSATSKSAPRI